MVGDRARGCDVDSYWKSPRRTSPLPVLELPYRSCGYTGHNGVIRKRAPHHRARRHDAVLPEIRSRQDHTIGPELAAGTDPNGSLLRRLKADGNIEIFVTVVLVGDVDIGPGLNVIADQD